MINERENALRILRHEGAAWLPCACDSLQFVNVSPAVESMKFGEDWFGVKWYDQIPDPKELLLDSFDDWEKIIKFPDLDALDWSGAAEIDCADLDRENKIVATKSMAFLLERVAAFAGIGETMIAFYTNPEELKALFSELTEFRLKQIDKMVQYYNPDYMMFHDDYGTQTGLFMSPDTWREFIKPYLKKLIDRVHEHGKFFCMHSCGKIDDIVGDLVELGVDLWDSVQPCNDYDSIFAKYGDKLAFMPTFDLQKYYFPDPEGIVASLHSLVDALGGKGLLYPRETSSLLHPDNKEAVLKEIRRIGIESVT